MYIYIGLTRCVCVYMYICIYMYIESLERECRLLLAAPGDVISYIV